jgi:hypothetical protein
MWAELGPAPKIIKNKKIGEIEKYKNICMHE